jgi:hypothetical protein
MLGDEGIRVLGPPDNNNKNRTRLGKFGSKVAEIVHLNPEHLKRRTSGADIKTY